VELFGDKFDDDNIIGVGVKIKIKS